LGEISAVRAVFNFSLTNPQNIRLIPEFGGGCLWDVGIYPVSFSQFILGETPEWVFGDQWLGPSGVDEAFAGQLHYAGGQLAQISSSFCTPYFTFAEISGSDGTLTLTQPFTALGDLRRVAFHPQGSEPFEIDVPNKELYLGEVEDMHAAILDRRSSKLSLAKSRDHIRTILALYESAQKKTPIQMNPGA
jgi:predicted dehydrogenase